MCTMNDKLNILSFESQHKYTTDSETVHSILSYGSLQESHPGTALDRISKRIIFAVKNSYFNDFLN